MPKSYRAATPKFKGAGCFLIPTELGGFGQEGDPALGSPSSPWVPCLPMPDPWRKCCQQNLLPLADLGKKLKIRGSFKNLSKIWV